MKRLERRINESGSKWSIFFAKFTTKHPQSRELSPMERQDNYNNSIMTPWESVVDNVILRSSKDFLFKLFKLQSYLSVYYNCFFSGSTQSGLMTLHRSRGASRMSKLIKFNGYMLICMGMMMNSAMGTTTDSPKVPRVQVEMIQRSWLVDRMVSSWPYLTNADPTRPERQNDHFLPPWWREEKELVNSWPSH